MLSFEIVLCDLIYYIFIYLFSTDHWNPALNLLSLSLRNVLLHLFWPIVNLTEKTGFLLLCVETRNAIFSPHVYCSCLPFFFIYICKKAVFERLLDVSHIFLFLYEVWHTISQLKHLRLCIWSKFIIVTELIIRWKTWDKWTRRGRKRTSSLHREHLISSGIKHFVML